MQTSTATTCVMRGQSFRDLDVYRCAIEFQQEVFKSSKTWPLEEKFSLTDQARRSARAVGANLAEAWAKRRYPAHFLSKLTDADGELQEITHWLDSALKCRYLSEGEYAALNAKALSIGKMLGAMIRKYHSFCEPA